MISIALATYNGEKYLEEQLNSLLQQTLQPAELIVCDDMSTDGTPDIVRRFAASAPFPVHFTINQERLGYQTNFMKAAALCKSDFIAFCDQDDIWSQEKIEIVYKNLNQSSHLLLLHGYRLIDMRGCQISDDIEYPAAEVRSPWVPPLGLTLTFHKSLLAYSHLWELSVDDNYGNQKMGHDQWIDFIAPLLGSIIIIPDVLVFYRQHGSNVFGYHQRDVRTLFSKIKNNVNVLSSYFGGYHDGFFERKAWFEQYVQRKVIGTQSRIKVLEAIVEIAPEDRKGLINNNIVYYKKWLTYYSSRSNIYFSKSRAYKLFNIFNMYISGLYFKKGVRGIKDGVLDLFYGVLC